MADFNATIEALEHQWMRAWVESENKKLTAMTSKSFRFVLGGEKPVLLDRASLVRAPKDEFSCRGYRFGKIYTRKHGRMALFATPAELEMTLDGGDWKGSFWLQDLWVKLRGRGWRMEERSLSRLENDMSVAKSLHALQLWN